MSGIAGLRVKIFADVADIEDFKRLSELDLIDGFTTNPTLMRKAGVTDYLGFIEELLPLTGGRSVSFEVIGDDFDEMERQALALSGFGDNVFVKIPVTDTRGNSSCHLISDLSARGVKLNVTALMSVEQVERVLPHLAPGVPAIVSIFAGRIADTGIDPVPIMKRASELLSESPYAELLWASPRELLNVFQADEAGCDIITILPEIIAKFHRIGQDLGELSLETVKMFYDDAVSSGLTIPGKAREDDERLHRELPA